MVRRNLRNRYAVSVGLYALGFGVKRAHRSGAHVCNSDYVMASPLPHTPSDAHP